MAFIGFQQTGPQGHAAHRAGLKNTNRITSDSVLRQRRPCSISTGYYHRDKVRILRCINRRDARVQHAPHRLTLGQNTQAGPGPQRNSGRGAVYTAGLVNRRPAFLRAAETSADATIWFKAPAQCRPRARHHQPCPRTWPHRFLNRSLPSDWLRRSRCSKLQTQRHSKPECRMRQLRTPYW